MNWIPFHAALFFLVFPIITSQTADDRVNIYTCAISFVIGIAIGHVVNRRIN